LRFEDRSIRDFAIRVRELRNARGVSQEKLAEEAGIHRTYLGGIELGLRNPSLKNIARIARALGVPIKELFA
jgi:transcriptional regulator with XRE-family HTH domain